RELLGGSRLPAVEVEIVLVEPVEALGVVLARETEVQRVVVERNHVARDDLGAPLVPAAASACAATRSTTSAGRSGRSSPQVSAGQARGDAVTALSGHAAARSCGARVSVATATSASTTAGSNCVPAQRRSSSIAVSNGRARR